MVNCETAIAVLKGFYFQRVSTALEPPFAGKWSRPAGHPDTAVLIHEGAVSLGRIAGTAISTPGGWYDAGDYNKYIVNSGISMGTMLFAYEDFPVFFKMLPGLLVGGPNPGMQDKCHYDFRSPKQVTQMSTVRTLPTGWPSIGMHL